jgi:hypothetical protein
MQRAETAQSSGVLVLGLLCERPDGFERTSSHEEQRDYRAIPEDCSFQVRLAWSSFDARLRWNSRTASMS